MIKFIKSERDGKPYFTLRLNREKIWTVSGPKFVSETGTISLVKKAQYGLKSADAVFRSLRIR